LALTTLNSHDFNADGKSDIAWRDTGGDAAVWLMNGAQVLQAAGVATVPTAWTIVGQRDFNGDGRADLLWQNTTTGDVAIWFMNGTQVTHPLSEYTRNLILIGLLR
jgi:FG-GAP-like repeat